jgi:tripartite-type tricarboxylate transporter receptor subunit TctC
MFRLLRTVLVACTFLAGAHAAAAAPSAEPGWPTHPIHMIVPWSAGGSTDLLGRLLAEDMGARLHGAIVVENKPGATGTIGYGYVARSPADGYTILLGTNSTFAIAPHFYHELPYNLDKDYAPIGMIGSNQQVLCVTPSMPVQTLADFVKLAKQKPDTITFESSGVGGSSHLAMELLESTMGISLRHIPYRAGAPAMQAIVGGETQSGFVDVSVAEPLIRSGRLRALGTSGLSRAPLLPNVPTLAEEGAKGFESTTSYALLVPAGTPPEIVKRLNTALNDSLRDPALKKKLEAQGFELSGGTPAGYQEYAVKESKKWGDLIEQRHITLQQQ